MSYEKIKALKIKIYQPQAHYRIPFSYQRRHTYPLPPYSTVMGLVANVLGIKNLPGQEEPCTKENCGCAYCNYKMIKIGVCGNFKSKSIEYTWLRNLNKEYHIKRFGTVANRNVAGHIEHIGGQSPCSIDILNDVRIFVYLYHHDNSFLNEIKWSFENMEKKSSILHLGRAEDWIVIEDLKEVELSVEEINGNYRQFFWIPERIFGTGFGEEFKKVSGLVYSLPTFYRIINGSRNFYYMKSKLNDGNMGDIFAYFDHEEKIPVFFADLKGDKNE
ncbi:type I-B CRISPR-associated protein Cas5b [Caldicellulosiruptor morganii]|uniref:Type I-B CRISPR-associated protein Cas5b n=1 Tax=Caldicellulosiruptor morganii TaxID=1387555 RepID=A0ABY7BLM1_9FIRM|nr:type I-B CRISPR-associated protein Cas5b [Caldicellulosiruptor morganii]WAM33738.1 type I-B CRISPR-associated protein Cas5b [Caldicellulosiruptor morganii]